MYPFRSTLDDELLQAVAEQIPWEVNALSALADKAKSFSEAIDSNRCASSTFDDILELWKKLWIQQRVCRNGLERLFSRLATLLQQGIKGIIIGDVILWLTTDGNSAYQSFCMFVEDLNATVTKIDGSNCALLRETFQPWTQLYPSTFSPLLNDLMDMLFALKKDPLLEGENRRANMGCVYAAPELMGGGPFKFHR